MKLEKENYDKTIKLNNEMYENTINKLNTKINEITEELK